MNKLSINRYLDHAVLKPEMTAKEVEDAIQLGIDYIVRTVCVRPCDIELAVRMCRGTQTEVCTVVGFPHGVVPSEVKAEEARLYIQKGVTEVDMVINYSYIKSGLWELVYKDVRAVSTLTRQSNVILKVIFETCLLTPEEIAKTTEICIEAKADFVKTSTGFSTGGASEEAVQIMLKTAGGRIKVKPSGGIRDVEKAMQYVEMGAERLGVNYASVPAICKGGKASGEGY
jgi:deoxyribose-phosphate aldolase